jgi:hypothetical protein
LPSQEVTTTALGLGLIRRPYQWAWAQTRASRWMEFSTLEQYVKRVLVIQCPTLDAADGRLRHAPCRARSRASLADPRRHAPCRARIRAARPAAEPETLDALAPRGGKRGTTQDAPLVLSSSRVPHAVRGRLFSDGAREVRLPTLCIRARAERFRLGLCGWTNASTGPGSSSQRHWRKRCSSSSFRRVPEVAGRLTTL